LRGKTHGRLADDLEGRIVASVYSLPSRWIAPDASEELLRAVRRIAPRRTLVVLADNEPPVRLRGGEGASNIVWVRGYGRTYSPWPRDPFSFLRRPDAGVLLLVRPNVQRQRENDVWMARELIQGIPESLDAAWGRVRWERSPVPFHNGQILSLPRTVWVSVHSLEVRILQLLGEERVPVDRLADAEGWSRYVGAAGVAAGELASLYGRRVEFVHPLDPATVPGSAFLEALGSGAGYDLDSLLTPLMTRDDRIVALVSDLDAGLEVLRRSTVDDLDRFSARWGATRAGDELRRQISEHQQSPPARRLDAFLEMISMHLRQTGVEVSRLPLLWIPPELMARPDAPLEQPFLITWNNVVQERVDGRARAERRATICGYCRRWWKAWFTTAAIAARRSTSGSSHGCCVGSIPGYRSRAAWRCCSGWRCSAVLSPPTAMPSNPRPRRPRRRRPRNRSRHPRPFSSTPPPRPAWSSIISTG
jgi:hypothetical protein